MDQDNQVDDARSYPPGEDASSRRLDAARLRIELLESQLAQHARSRAELIHLVGHELRTPITVISGFARLLLNPIHGELSDDQHRFVEESLKACRRLDDFVGDLLDTDPRAQTPFVVDPEPGDLRGTIEGSLEALLPMLEERGTKLEVSLRSDESPLPIDARRIEQVLTNMMTNAIRYGRLSGVIRVETREILMAGCRHVEVVVEDDGSGIPSEDRERLFEPFVRGEGAGEVQGLGIGLAICRRIIEAHGGSIRVGAGELGGARFCFSLPRVPATRAGGED